MEQPSLPHPNKIKMADDNRVGEKEREEMEEVEAEAIPEVELKERKTSWGRLRRVDSLSLEAGHVSMPRGHTSKTNWARTLSLAFQSMGVVYGDIGTSPLYVYAGTFSHREVKGKDDIIGVLSLIIYTLILVPLVKYVLIVLWANDNGDGGTFALYSLICRYARVGLIPNDQPEDIHLSNYRLDVPSHQSKIAQKIKGKLETSKAIQIILFIVTILGTSMVIGDGVLTPCISVLSAVSGISSSLGQDVVVGVSIAILIALFSIQRFGTDKVGLCFAPVISVWFMFLTGIGVYNLFKYDPSVLRAFNPKYILDYFKRNGKDAWISLGGVVLCITGAEAMFADLGHFSVKAIQISFSCTVFPSILAAYAGQAAYLMKHPENVSTAFYSSIPDPLYWPTFVVAVAAAVIASQAMISGAFAIVSQSLSLGCFPRVKVVHTSAKYEGQVYIPEINYLLMISCILVCWIFKTTENIGNAYGIAVVAVMVITTGMITLIMLVIWKTRMMWIVIFTVVYGAVEGTYLTAVLYKFKEGGFLPLAFSLVLMIIMGIWHYVQRERYIYELKNKVSSEFIKELAANSTINRVPGIGLLYSELVQGIPPIFPHFIANIPSVHSVLVFVSIKNIPISKVLPEERFLFRQVEPRDYKMFRCVVRYGYKDVIEEPREFERQLVENLKEFLRHEHFILDGSALDPAIEVHSANQSTQLVMDDKVKVSSSSRRIHVEESMPQPNPEQIPSASKSSGSIRLASSGRRISVQLQNGAEEEMQFVQKAMDRGVVYLIGETEVIAEPKSSLFKKMIVNIAYSFLRKNFRQGDKMLAIPKTRLLRVGMTYEI